MEWGRKMNKNSVQKCMKESTLTLQVVGYRLQRFRCDYSLKFLYSTGLTVWAPPPSFPLITLNLFPLPILISPFLKHLGGLEKHLENITVKIIKNSTLHLHSIRCSRLHL